MRNFSEKGTPIYYHIQFYIFSKINETHRKNSVSNGVVPDWKYTQQRHHIPEDLRKTHHIRIANKNPDIPPKTDFLHASDLITFIKTKGDFDIAGACYPEGHPDSDSLVDDIINLRKKVEAGADHLITQLFFDNEYFYDFREKAAIAGINVPIEAGIMPVVNKNQIERMVTTCGASLPKKFVKIMQKYEHNPEALRDAGIAYAVNQIVDLVANGVDGIHLYTMNNPYVAQKITEAVSGVISV